MLILCTNCINLYIVGAAGMYRMMYNAVQSNRTFSNWSLNFQQLEIFGISNRNVVMLLSVQSELELLGKS